MLVNDTMTIIVLLLLSVTLFNFRSHPYPLSDGSCRSGLGWMRLELRFYLSHILVSLAFYSHQLYSLRLARCGCGIHPRIQ